jgi:tetratricopeptide (TPR) repeat protein
MNELPTIDAERPWPGLLPFGEDSRMYFHGREAETDELFRLIEREPLTVLFGQSGLGKSSLLNAGVFPDLRRAGYLPVYLRLSLEAGAPVLIDQVWQALKAACANHEVSASAVLAGDGFWQYLHRPETQFLNPHGRPVVPVLAFDQFEEIFTLGRQTPEQTTRTQLMLQQLGELIENRLPPALERELTVHPELLDQFDLLRQNIKMVFTFREDYLAEFESLKTVIRPIMQNRMRLTPMRGDRAAAAIETAGGGLLSASVAARIVRFVGGAARGDSGQLEEISIEPALLSLVCRELNEQRIARGQAEISADLIQGENTQQIIAQFYNQGFAGLDVRVRYFVEDRLLTTAGYRDSCALDNALAEPGVSEAAIQSLVDRRILRREERGGLVRIELIHDVLALVAKESRDTRHEATALEAARQQLAKQRRRQRIIVVWAAVLVACLVGVSWLAVVASRGKKQAVSAQQQADQEAKVALEQKKVALDESVRERQAEDLAVSKQAQLAGALEKADEATHTAKSEADAKEAQRWQAVVWAAAADEQLDAGGTGEKLRACVDSTNRLTDDPAKASRDYMVGVWHVDQGVSSTDQEWRSDGTCVSRHIYENGFELDLKNDVCTWSYKPIAGHDDEFEMDWASKMLGPQYTKQLIFKITSRTRMRNINVGYDAFRIICPAQELSIRQGELATLQKQADANPGSLEDQAALASGFDKLGTALSAQNDFANAFKNFDQELTICQQVAQHGPAGSDCLKRTAPSFEQLGNQEFNVAATLDQAGDGQGGTQNATAAIASFQKNLAIRLQLLRADPADVDAQHNAALASNHAGIVLYWVGQNTAGIDAIRTAAQMLEKITETHGGETQVRVDLLWILYNLSQRSNVGTEAKDSLTKSLAIAMELAREPGSPDNMPSVVKFLQGAKPR